MTFESIFVRNETIKRTNTTTWKGEKVPISVTISSNVVEEPIVLRNYKFHHLLACFVEALEKLASQSEAKVTNFFLDIEVTVRVKLGSILEKLNQCHIRLEQVKRSNMNQDDSENENCCSTHFLQIQKNQVIDLEELRKP